MRGLVVLLLSCQVAFLTASFGSKLKDSIGNALEKAGVDGEDVALFLKNKEIPYRIDPELSKFFHVFGQRVVLENCIKFFELI